MHKLGPFEVAVGAAMELFGLTQAVVLYKDGRTLKVRGIACTNDPLEMAGAQELANVVNEAVQTQAAKDRVKSAILAAINQKGPGQ